MAKKRALLLGAGLVAAPVVRYLAEHGLAVTIASNTPDRAAELLSGRPGDVLSWDASDQQTLGTLIDRADVVISLLPATMHVPVAKCCVTARRSMVTASYVSEGMEALDQAARDAEILLLNELGLDPGIDHMSAMRLLDGIRARGGRVSSFRSYCGGIPAPEANDNPWGYKFSWSPEGVLRASLNDATYLELGQTVQVPAAQLFDVTHELLVEGAGELEAYANRDSLSYISLYGLEGISTMLRATLRHPGWCETLSALGALGLLDSKPLAPGNWAGFWKERFGSGEPESLVRSALGKRGSSDICHRLEWLGLFEDQPISGAANLLAALAQQMADRMAYGPSERDMVVMHHDIKAQFDAGEERWLSSLVACGEPGGDSAMASTVGLPVAIAARLIVEGRLAAVGVQIPVSDVIYQPVLAELEAAGIAMNERRAESCDE